MPSDKPSNRKEIRVYTTNFCPYCVNAKKFLTSLGLPFSEINLEENPELRAKLSSENTGWRTGPMIVIGDHFVGGFTDLKALHDSGKMNELL